MDAQNPLLPVIVGGLIGLISALAANAFATYLSRISKRSKIAARLLIEIESYERPLTAIRDLIRSIDEQGVLHLSELGDRPGSSLDNIAEGIPEEIDFYEDQILTATLLRAEGPIPHTTIYTATLQEQGLLHRTTLEHLHTFYAALHQAVEYQRIAMNPKNKVQMLAYLKVAEEKATKTLGTIEPLKAKLKAEKKWWKPSAPDPDRKQ